MAVEQLEDLLKQRDPILRAYHQGYLDRDRELSYLSQKVWVNFLTYIFGTRKKRIILRYNNEITFKQ